MLCLSMVCDVIVYTMSYHLKLWYINLYHIVCHIVYIHVYIYIYIYTHTHICEFASLGYGCVHLRVRVRIHLHIHLDHLCQRLSLQLRKRLHLRPRLSTHNLPTNNIPTKIA